MGEKEESDMCGKTTKGIAKGKASVPYKGRSTGKEVKEGRKGEGSTHGQATRSAARMEEEFNGRIEEESGRTLWQRSARGSMPTGVRIVHRGGNSDICAV